MAWEISAGLRVPGDQYMEPEVFSHTDSDVVRNRLDHCDNYAAVTTTTGRAAGILGAANSRTTLRACTNRGDIMDRFSGNARVAGIVSLLGSASFLHDCSNYGVVAATRGQRGRPGLPAQQ